MTSSAGACSRICHDIREALYAGKFFQSGRPSRLYELLGAFDSMLLVDHAVAPTLNSEHATYGYWQTRKVREAGFAYGIQMLADRCPWLLRPSASESALDEAGWLLKDLGALSMLEELLVQSRSGLFAAELEPELKRITFHPTDMRGDRVPSGAYIEGVFDPDDSAGFAAHQAAKNAAWRDDGTPYLCVRDGHLNLVDARTLGRLRDPTPFLQEHPSDAWCLDSGATIDGVAISDYDLFCAALTRWSEVVQRAYLQLTLDGAEQSAVMPVQISSAPRIARVVRLLTGVREEASRHILGWLEYLPGDRRSDPFIQPFVHAEDKLGWSASCMTSRLHRRNLLKRLARVPQLGQSVKAVLGARAERMTARLAGLLRGLGYVVHTAKKFKDAELEGDIDMLAWQPANPSRLLLCECKAMLAPDSSYELEMLTREREHAELQLDKCMRVLQARSDSQLSEWLPGIPWSSNLRPSGIVCFLQGMGFLRGRHFKYPCCSLMLLEQQMPRARLADPDLILQSITSWDWKTPGSIELGDWLESTVGGWTIRMPQFTVRAREC